MVITSSAGALVWPGAVVLAALAGAVRAWSGRSVLNGAYLAGCLLLLAILGGVLASRLTFRLEADTRRATVWLHGFYRREVLRAEALGFETETVARRGVVRAFPVLRLRDGSNVRVRGAGDWAFAAFVVRTWRLPLEKVVGAEGRP